MCARAFLIWNWSPTLSEYLTSRFPPNLLWKWFSRGKQREEEKRAIIWNEAWISGRNFEGQPQMKCSVMGGEKACRISVYRDTFSRLAVEVEIKSVRGVESRSRRWGKWWIVMNNNDSCWRTLYLTPLSCLVNSFLSSADLSLDLSPPRCGPSAWGH